jgi:hypothetical protein
MCFSRSASSTRRVRRDDLFHWRPVRLPIACGGDDHTFVPPALSPNSEVASGGNADEAMTECARPRAQQVASFKPRNISQPPA